MSHQYQDENSFILILKTSKSKLNPNNKVCTHVRYAQIFNQFLILLFYLCK